MEKMIELIDAVSKVRIDEQDLKVMEGNEGNTKFDI